MRKLVTALASLAVVFLLIPSVGLAIEVPVDTGVGILGILSADDIEMGENILNPAPTGQFALYFFLFNEQIPSNNLGGVEFSWRFEGPGAAPLVLSLEWPPRPLVLGNPPFDLVVGFGDGLLTQNNHARIMKANLFYSVPPTEPVEIYLGPATIDSIDGEMAYNELLNPGNIVIMRPNSNGGLYENPVFGFNVTVATQGETWGAVKSLFR